jgi:Cdc6-like AAA superfamily ATPase
VDAIIQNGQHAVIFGERGVGKTSLANILASKLTAGSAILAPRVNCDSTDDFSSLWRKIFAQVDLIQEKERVGFQGGVRRWLTPASEAVPERATPEDVRQMLSILSDTHLVIVIFDEFDRLRDQIARRTMADTIKALSDHDVRATVVIVGVADTVDDLVAEQSVH